MKIKICDNEKLIYRYYVDNGNLVVIFQSLTMDELKTYFESMSDVKIMSDDVELKDLSEYEISSIQYEDMITIRMTLIDTEKAEMQEKIAELEKSNEAIEKKNQMLTTCILEMSELIYTEEEEADEEGEEVTEDE